MMPCEDRKGNTCSRPVSTEELMAKNRRMSAIDLGLAGFFWYDQKMGHAHAHEHTS